MKKNAMKILFVVWILSFIITAQAVAVPQYFNYSGVLRDTAGNLQTGSFTMTFKIYNAATGGTAVYNSGAQTVAVSNGLYGISLEATGSVFDGNDKWIEQTVGTDVLSPRLKIQSVAYAIRTETADSALNSAKLGGLSTAESGSGTFIPVTSSGKLNITTIPTNEVNANKVNGLSLVVGTATLIASEASVTITNSAVTANSTILIIPRRDGIAGAAWLKIKSKSAGQFVVTTYDEVTTNSNPITIDYLVIN